MFASVKASGFLSRLRKVAVTPADENNDKHTRVSSPRIGTDSDTVRPMSDSASTSDLLARPMRRQLTKRVVLPAGSSKQASDATNHERHVQALAHDKSQDELISHMRSSAATMRKQFADSKEIARNLKEHEESLQAAMGSSSQELTKMQTFNEESGEGFRSHGASASLGRQRVALP